VDASLTDADLERLLAQLLRAVSPPAVVSTARGSWPDAKENTGAGSRESGTGARSGKSGSGTGSGKSGSGAGSAKSGTGAESRESGSGAGSRDARDGDGLPAVSASEARALIELLAARGIAQGQLGSLLGLEKSTVSRLAAGLERKGWLRRGRDEANQRYVRLYLTPRGKAVAEEVWQAWQSRQERILRSLSDEERTGLAAGLRGLMRGLSAEGLLGGGH
jgi:DNA-binding MarR family transcriptional regulator